MGNKSIDCVYATGTYCDSGGYLGTWLRKSSRFHFLFQVLTYKGFYDTNLEWVGLEGVQIVASMTAGSGLGRHKLTSRFTSVVRICAIEYVLNCISDCSSTLFLYCCCCSSV